ncbi:MAG: hypothetical protein RTV72_17680 [Candidatus Thorarchaeota archaeon]
MNRENAVAEITSLLTRVHEIKSDIEAEHERFRIALAGTLRLLTGEGGTILANIQGDPDALKGYLISQESKLASLTTGHLKDISERLEKLLETVQV